ncbi:hypothetical protein OQH60_06645 [Campylobacter sp. MIT 21-1685]|uniref:hypothetical protein n=1 Tax=unclassified Campylobacter TaxID=2593542 RepID=UPI00224B12C4|nr:MULTISPECIES: hypothetical protein [unclassified Campylobacter]MCX2683542.1 hypothetical protein [Campylobacter sp. MIT 21-1684]MCX2751797.1 hypothetical protein [Campylobacter sp. MIT 21-1682]MCX2808026.1 hypothetical protein [Campylobacter sp. MIT 21-1685]
MDSTCSCKAQSQSKNTPRDYIQKIFQFKTFKFLLIFCLSLSFCFSLSACSSKTQTNKLPNEKKYSLFNSNSNINTTISEKSKNEFEEALKEFFKVKQQEEDSQNIYKIGIERGYF